MNKKTLLTALVIGALFASCSKDESTPTPAAGGGGGGGTPPPTTTYLISQDSTYNNTNIYDTKVRKFEYNSNKKLVKVMYKWGTSTTFNEYDTIYYNTNGQVSKVERYLVGIPTATTVNTYTYLLNNLIAVLEVGINNNGPYTRTRSFTYSGGKAISQNVDYTVGSNSNGGPENIKSITYSGNNVSSANIYMDMGAGFQWIPITLTSSTTAPNPYYGLNYDSEDFINLFNQNNILKAYITASPTDIFVDNTYTYSNGRVATIDDASEGRLSYITYIAL